MMNIKKNMIKILLIEDDKDDIEFIGELLYEDIENEFTIDSAGTLNNATEKLKNPNFDVVLLDLTLPDSLGLNTFLHLKSYARYLPFIILTGASDKEAAVKAVREGAQDYLNKWDLTSAILSRSIVHSLERQHFLNRIFPINNQFYKIIEKNADGIIILDNKGIIRFVNPAAEIIFGKSADFLIGEELGLPVLLKEKTEIEIFRPREEITHVEIRLVDLSWEGESAYLASLRDITERKNMEQKLKENADQLEALNRNLENRVNEEITKKIENERLLVQQSKMAAMGEMIGVIAHQWRQPLNSLGAVIQDVRDAYYFKELDDEYIDNAADNALNYIQFMSQTVDDFRNFYKPVKAEETFDIVKAIKNVLEMLSFMLKNNGIDVDFNSVIDGSFAVKSFPNEFMQVILNILNNAGDAIQSGREKGVIKSTDGEICINVYSEKEMAVVTIEDNGGGIPNDIIDKIFEPYFTTKANNNGTGIGLYMSKIIIETNMKGLLTAESMNGKALFRIALPHSLRSDVSWGAPGEFHGR